MNKAMKPMDELNEQVWGVRFNEQNFCKFNLEAPEWVKACEDNSAWYSEGVVIAEEA